MPWSGVREGLKGFSTDISGQRTFASGRVVSELWFPVGRVKGSLRSVCPQLWFWASREAERTRRSWLCSDKPSGVGLPHALQDPRSPPLSAQGCR